MSQELKLKIRGLHTHASDLSSVPEGALSKADDIVIDKEDVAEPRRGFNRSSGAFVDAAYRANKLFLYQDRLFSHYGTNLLAYYSTQLNNSAANFTGSGAWTAITGTYAPPTDVKVRSVEANQNLYFTSAAGVYKLDSYSATPARTGAYKGLDIAASIVSASGNWLAVNSYVAYRAVWGYRDANNNLLLGAPSQSEIIQNTSLATSSVNLRITIPDGVTTAWFYQVYRSASETVEPNDELQLVYESNPNSTDISNKYVAFDDITPVALRGATIYTAATQEGLAKGNEQPPQAKDIAVFKNTVFYANTTSKHRKYLTLLASGGVNGLAVDDVVTVGGVAYVAKLTETAASAQFRIYVPVTFTFVDADVNIATETFTKTAHGLSNGDPIQFSTTVALPVCDPVITAATTYYIVGATTDTFQIAVTLGGAAILVTTAAAGGTHTLTYMGTASQNIRNTAISFVRTVNRYTASTVIAYYASDTGALPGKILLEEELLGGSAFYVGSTEDSCWFPSTVPLTQRVASVDTAADTFTITAHGYANGTALVPSLAASAVLPSGIAIGTTYYVVSTAADTFKLAATLGGAAIDLGAGLSGSVYFNTIAEASSNDRFKNGISFSKTSQPEAVPLTNFFFVGSADQEILRIIPLRDSLFIMKEDGIYRLSGEDGPSFRIDLFDSTTRLLASESAVVLNNQIFCLTDQGVVSISESGVQVRSRAIESTLLAILGVNSTVLRNDSFGVAYDTERKYILFVPTLAGDTTPTQAYVFNTFTNTWTRWVLNKTAGIVNPADDKLYLGDGSSAYVNQERKSLTFQDYVDYGFATTISAVNGLTLTLGSTDLIAVGDIIYQSSSVYSIVTAVNTTAGTVTVSFAAAFTVAATDVLKAIQSKIAWVPITLGNPGALKHFREVTLLFKTDFTGDATLVFTSDTSPAPENETVQGTAIGLWGLFAWGGVPWGGTQNRRPIRLWIPRNKQRASQLTIEFRHSTGYAKYQMNGISIVANGIGERVAV